MYRKKRFASKCTVRHLINFVNFVSVIGRRSNLFVKRSNSERKMATLLSFVGTRIPISERSVSNVDLFLDSPPEAQYGFGLSRRFSF